MSVDESRRFCKTILISYSREECEPHARRLKNELETLGLDVFLDVDEIEGGDDWYDALNHAILNCQLFIPLISPEYGYTQWTNREVKLADIKKKLIIPISFLDTWPPECLAIQFASTHYIPWKTATDIENSLIKGEGEKARDIRFWDNPFVRRVASEIAKRFRRIRPNITAPNSDLLNGLPFTAKSSLGVAKGRHQVVISAHPVDKAFAKLMSQELAKKFKVWSTTDMSIERFYSSSNNRMTPTVEGQTCSLSPEDYDRAKYFKDRVDASTLVIIVLSNNYCISRICKQQAFYCETRKKIIPIKLNEFESPEWVSKLFEEDEVLEHTPHDLSLFIDQLTERVSARAKSECALYNLSVTPKGRTNPLKEDNIPC